MGQRKGNPTPSYQNQAYMNLYPNDPDGRNEYNDVTNVQIDKDITLSEYVQQHLKGNYPISSSYIVVNGTIRADEYIVNKFSSSVIYTSGSSKFGDTSDDFHQFTGSILISGSVFHLSSLTFNSSSVPSTLEQYTLAANTTDKTLDLKMGNTATLQLGMEMYYPPIVNKSGVDLQNGTLVMINPARVAQGNRLSVVRCVGDGTYPSDFIVGVLTEDIAKNAEGFATWFGYVRDVALANVRETGNIWAEGDILYPSATEPGKLTNIEPTAPAMRSTIAAVTKLLGANCTLLVRPTLKTKLNDLDNVNTSTRQTGSLLYNSGSIWTSTNSVKASNTTIILTQVSESLNFVNDTAAAAGGVPLGGVYRNGNVIQIRLI